MGVEEGMKEFSVGFAFFFLIQMIRPRKVEIKGFFGITLAVVACYGLGTVILRFLP